MVEITKVDAGYAIGYKPDSNVCRPPSQLIDQFMPTETPQWKDSPVMERRVEAIYATVRQVRVNRDTAIENRARAKRNPAAPYSKFR